MFYVEQTAGLVSLLTWLLFGAVAVPTVFEHADWQVVGYAVLSLTVVRMLPVALALTRLWAVAADRGLHRLVRPTRTGLDHLRADRPRGAPAEADQAVAVIGMTVLLSVFAHGLSAKPLANRYGATVADLTQPTGAGLTQPAVRGLLRRHPHPASTTSPDGTVQ